MRKLTIAQACASTNIWFKVESEEQQRMFQEEFFRQGGSWFSGTSKITNIPDCKAYNLSEEGLSYCHEIYSLESEQVQIIWQEEPSIVIDSLAKGATLQATLDTSLNWQDTLALLTQLKNEELTKDFISDKCLRKMEDVQLASLARFLVEKRAALENYPAEHTEEADIIKGFVLSAVKYKKAKTSKTKYWYAFYRKDVEHIVRYSQAGLYQEELKNSPEWEGLSWERRGGG